MPLAALSLLLSLAPQDTLEVEARCMSSMLEESGDTAAVRSPDAERDPQPHQGFRAWINFDGGTLTYAGSAGNEGDDATIDRTGMAFGSQNLGGAFPAYGDTAKQEAIWQAVLADWEGRNINLVRERPASGSYSAIWVGPSDFPQRVGNPNGTGIAWADCGNRNLKNVGFAFFGAATNETTIHQAKTISHELSHTMGLEHVSHSTAIMVSGFTTPDPAFVDECAPLREGAGDCATEHQRFCSPGQQNESQEIDFILGEGSASGPEPTVTFLSPGDGSAWAAEATVRVALSVEDDLGDIREVRLSANGAAQGALTAAPYSWELTGLVDGTYVLAAEADDGDGNTGTAMITISVGDPTANTSTTGASGSGGPGGTSGVSDGGTEATAFVETDTLPLPEMEGGGGGCRATGAPNWAWAGLLLPLLGIRRRRG